LSVWENARRDGLLSLEKQLDDTQSKTKIDPLLKRGLLMVIDGAELDQIRDFMETEVYIYEQQKKSDATMFETLATYAPAYGMIGTIVGLIQVLANMESPEQMASAMAVAFITTLYGSLLANGLCLPAAGKVKLRLGAALLEKEMIIEGVCSIRNGQNPKALRDKLSVYLESDPKALKVSKTHPKNVKEAPAGAKKN
jgi:chemotaxis protein MotA